MYNEFNFPVSVEEFAAYLDGNLSEEGMARVSSIIANNASMQELAETSQIVADTMDSYSAMDLELPEELASLRFNMPEIENIDIFSDVADGFVEKDHLYQQEGMIVGENEQQESEPLKTDEDMATNYRTYGESGENIYDPIYIQQPDDHSCGLRSQQIVLRDFGIDIPFEELERYALDAGVYSENGTYTYDIGKVLEMAGVGMHQVQGSTIYDLTNELAQGHRVIVGVDANELWYNDSIGGKLSNWFNDVIGQQGGNHALIVAGVEVNPSNPNDVKVVLTDPGAGHLRIEYPFAQFMDAWQDSNCFMAATDQAAPYQYDAATGMEVPSNFAVEHHFNQFIVDNSYQLNPDMINVPTGYHPAFHGHLDIIGDFACDDFDSQYLIMNDEDVLSSFPNDMLGDMVEPMISENEDLSSFVNELNEESLIGLNDFAACDYINMDANFALSEILDYNFGTGSNTFADVPNVFENLPISDCLVGEDFESLKDGLDEDFSYGNMDVDIV